jgi:hypothetical protein
MTSLSLSSCSAGTILCLVYPAQAIALGAVFLAVLELNCLPLDASARGHSSFSATNAAQAWYELMKNDISTEDLMGTLLSLSYFLLSLTHTLSLPLSCVQSDD